MGTACRSFELSEKDKALFRDMHEAVSNQGAQSQAQHAALLDVFQQMETRLRMQVSNEPAPSRLRGTRPAATVSCTVDASGRA